MFSAAVFQLCLILLFYNGLKACSKFQSAQHSTYQVTVKVDGGCYYGFLKRMTWSYANHLCTGEGTHLVYLETVKEQQKVYHALGPKFAQHWTGLRLLNSTWYWLYSVTKLSVVATNDVAGRWNGSSVGHCAHTVSAATSSYLVAASETANFVPVCEEAETAVDTSSTVTTIVRLEQSTDNTEMTSEHTSDISEMTSKQPTEKIETTTTGLNEASAESSGEVSTGYFYRQRSLTAAQILLQGPGTTRRACAVRCLRTAKCRHYIFTELSGATCQLYQASIVTGTAGIGHASLITCGLTEQCYSRVFTSTASQ